jgi:hypothetical protein
MCRSRSFTLTTTVAICVLLLGGCKKSGLSLDDLPRYPNAVEKESMEQSSPFGIVSGRLVQFTTSDTHDQVLSFYKTALEKYNPEIISHELPDGRQTAIDITERHGVVTVAIQEYPKEGKVVLTFMRVGR